MKRISLLSFLLLFALLLPLSACTGNPTEGTPTADPNASEAPSAESTETPKIELPPLTIAENGKTEFIIVRPADAGEEIVGACFSLRTMLKKYTGAEIEITEDWAVKDHENKYEILIGAVDREETRQVTETLRYKDFFVGVVGKKIVLTGLSPENTAGAATYFENKIVIAKGKLNSKTVKVTMGEDENFRFVDNRYLFHDITVGGSSIRSYSIVIAKEPSIAAFRFAHFLQALLADACGYYLPIVSDNKSSGEQEIRVGATARTVTAPEEESYRIAVSGKALELTAESHYAFDALYTVFKEEILSSKNPEAQDNLLSFGENYQKTGKADTPALVQNRTGEIRIMFNNCLGNYGSANEPIPFKQRSQQLQSIYLEYLPDVLGLQECSPTARSDRFVTDLVKTGLYEEVAVTATNSNKNNYTPLLYRKDKLNLLAKGWHLYDDKANDKSKSITYGIFETKDTKQKFAVLSTHFYYTSDDAGKAARIIDAKELLALSEKLATEYKCPIIAGGDLNCNMSSDPIGILTTGGFKLMQQIAEKTTEVRAHHSYPKYNEALGYYDTCFQPTGNYRNSIDHILLYGTGVKARTFEVITEEYALLSSDHSPIFVDIDFES